MLNNLQHVKKLKQLNKGMSYFPKEEKQKDKVKALEDHIVIEAAPNLNNSMIHSDN